MTDPDKPMSCGCSEPHPADSHFYVTVRDGERYGFALGPYTTHGEAIADVPLARKLARKADLWSAFYGFGTAAVKLTYVEPGTLEKLRGAL